ncbi:MAG: hypothetical protein ACTH3D_09395 [Halomonas sp.]
MDACYAEILMLYKESMALKGIDTSGEDEALASLFTPMAAATTQ